LPFSDGNAPPSFSRYLIIDAAAADAWRVRDAIDDYFFQASRLFARYDCFYALPRRRAEARAQAAACRDVSAEQRRYAALCHDARPILRHAFCAMRTQDVFAMPETLFLPACRPAIRTRSGFMRARAAAQSASPLPDYYAMMFADTAIFRLPPASAIDSFRLPCAATRCQFHISVISPPPDTRRCRRMLLRRLFFRRRRRCFRCRLILPSYCFHHIIHVRPHFELAILIRLPPLAVDFFSFDAFLSMLIFACCAFAILTFC